VAADYRINAYFRGPNTVYVNLYVPSTLRWTEGGSALSLTQEGEYPYEDHVAFNMSATQPAEFALNLRVPEWAQGAQIFVNGTRQKDAPEPGKFASIRREWKSGDRVELELPLKARLESIDPQHSDTVALLRGPLVLMAVKPEQTGSLPKVTRAQLLAVNRVSEREWQVRSGDGAITMRPFTWLGSRPYTTYVKVS
jgi:DUF1680 family protein